MLVCPETFEQFLQGPSFYGGHRDIMLVQFSRAKNALQDALVACAISRADDVYDMTPSQLDQCYRRASAALGNLRSMVVASEDDLAQCSILGVLILTFASRFWSDNIADIARQTLDLIKPVYDQIQPMKRESMLLLSCLVMTELVDDLLYCRVPTVKMRPSSDTVSVDPYLGLCVPFLSYLHGLCELGDSLKNPRQINVLQTNGALDSIMAQLATWQPSAPDAFATSYTSVEVAHMLVQPQVLRTGALIIIHRLRYPFNVNDEPAYLMALSILTQLETTWLLTKSVVKGVEIAIITALLELKDEQKREQWLGKTSSAFGSSDTYTQGVDNIVKPFWEIREFRYDICWQNMGPLIKSFAPENDV